jgi:hypothetical protein
VFNYFGDAAIDLFPADIADEQDRLDAFIYEVLPIKYQPFLFYFVKSQQRPELRILAAVLMLGLNYC